MNVGEVKNKKVGVLMGGLSNEREVSLRTGAAVLASLARMGINAVGVDPGRDFCAQVKNAGVDIVFIALHGRYGEDGCIQGALEVMGVPYTSSGVTASSIAMSKRLTKDICKAIGVQTPEYSTFFRSDAETAERITAPVVIKPANGGSSIGVTICPEQGMIKDALEKAFAEDKEVMAERFIDGVLLTIGVIGDIKLPAIQIEPKAGFYDYNNKYTPGATEYIIPARMDAETLTRAEDAVFAVHKALGCRGATRSEVIVDRDGGVWFIELNTIPGMTETSLLPKAAASIGMSFDDLVLAILLEAVSDD